MQTNTDQHATQITVSDDARRVAREAVPVPSQPKAVIPSPVAAGPGVFGIAGVTSIRSSRAPRNDLARRGLRLMGWTFVGTGLWFYGFRLVEGRFPPLSSVAACAGLLLIVSLGMMLIGTQDQIREKKVRGP